MARRRKAAWLALTGLGLVGLASCASEPDPVDEEIWALTGSGDPAKSDIDRVIGELVRAGGHEYRAPSRVVPFRAGEVPDIPCAEGDVPENWGGNASYCDVDESIAYDVDFLLQVKEELGLTGPLAILAHEWGHHARHLRPVSGTRQVQGEFEADCIAGVFLNHHFGDSAEAETFFAGLYSLGDDVFRQAAWFSLGVHGTAQQRLNATAQGWISSGVDELASCEGLISWRPGLRAQIGPVNLLELPGHQGVVEEGVYRVPAGSLPGFELSTHRVSSYEDPVEALEEWLASPSGQPESVTALVVMEGATDVRATIYVERAGEGQEPMRELVTLELVRNSPGDVVVVRSTLPPGLRSEEEIIEAFQSPAALQFKVLQRLCHPGEHADDPAQPGFNYVCHPDL